MQLPTRAPKLAYTALPALVFALAWPVQADAGDVWKPLRRPLRIPVISTNAPCPTTPANGSLAAVGIDGAAFGNGPVFPYIGTKKRAILHFAHPPPSGALFSGSAWGGQRIRWIVRGYGGPLLIRAHQLNGRNQVRFGLKRTPVIESRILPPVGAPPVRVHPTYARFKSAGCYGFQLDGRGFSRVVTVEVRVWRKQPNTFSDALAGLHSQGVFPQPLDAAPITLGSVRDLVFGLPTGNLHVWEFTDEAMLDAIEVEPSGSDIHYPLSGGLHVLERVSWIAPAHWYRCGRLLAVYVGADSATLTALDRVLGAQFAGD